MSDKTCVRCRKPKPDLVFHWHNSCFEAYGREIKEDEEHLAAVVAERDKAVAELAQFASSVAVLQAERDELQAEVERLREQSPSWTGEAMNSGDGSYKP